NYKAWSQLADIQKLADQYQFIIVCPDGLKKSWYLDSPRRDSSQFESFFIKELMPKIFQTYSADSKNVFIAGASMGGYGAMWLFLRHPNLFRSAGSTSGVLNLRYSGFKKTTLAEHLGAYSDENKAFDNYSAINNLVNIVGLNKSLIFDCGTEDYLYIANKKFRDKCDELKIKATYIAKPGAHTGSYWSGSILTHFSFFSDLIIREKKNK
ncbi:MAG: esterase, partial [Daejeonella sp.]|nr:esterase [Daejeonella sp.]